MSYKTVQGILHPNGTLTLTGDQLPAHPVPVMVIILEPDEELALANLGDYHGKLTDYRTALIPLSFPSPRAFAPSCYRATSWFPWAKAV